MNPKEMVVGHVDEDCLTASTRVGGAMAGAAAITALALSQKVRPWRMDVHVCPQAGPVPHKRPLALPRL